MYSTFRRVWTIFWMRNSGLSTLGRISAYFAAWFTPPYKGRTYLAHITSKSFISPDAIISHKAVHLEENVFIGEGVIIYQTGSEGHVRIGKGSHLHKDIIIETGAGGGLTVGSDTHIQPRCQFSAYKGQIRIGNGVQIAPYCAFYPYNHGFAPDKLIKEQPLQTKGGIVIEDDAWLGVGVIVLDGLRIGKGAVIGAGSVVTRDIPDGAIAAGVPARVVKMRSELT